MAIAREAIRRRLEMDTTELVAFYRAAILELKERARQRLILDGRTLMAEARRTRLVIREIAQVLQELEGNRSTWVAKNVPKAYLKGVRQATLGLSEIGVATSGTINPGLHREAIQLLVNDMQDAFTDVDGRLLRGMRRVLRKTQLNERLDKFVTKRVAHGVAGGKARREVSNELVARLLDEYGDKPIRIGGKNYAVDRYAEMVARTKTAEAVTAGTINRLAEEGQDLVMVSAHGATDGCGFYEGKVFSIGGESDQYPPVSQMPNGGPPFHPNCRHGLAPFVERFATGAEKRRATGVPVSALGKEYAAVEKIARAA